MAIEPMRFTAIPKYITITLETLDSDGSVVSQQYKVYQKGPGCPVPVVIETDNVYADYEDNYPSTEDRNTMSNDRYLARARRANLLQYRDLLLAITPNLPEDIANNLAYDEENKLGLKILELARWREVIAETELESEEKTKGEEETGELILQTPTPSIKE